MTWIRYNGKLPFGPFGDHTSNGQSRIKIAI